MTFILIVAKSQNNYKPEEQKILYKNVIISDVRLFKGDKKTSV